VNAGGKHTLFNALVATVDKGDEVIIPAPYWVSYPDIVQFAGGTPVDSAGGCGSGLQDHARAARCGDHAQDPLADPQFAVEPDRRCLYRARIEALGEVLLRHPHVMLLTDDMYEHIWYAQQPFATMLQVCPDLYDRTLTMNGASKAYAMTGWRIGYAGGPEWLIKAMGDLQSQSTSNPCSISQYAVAAASTARRIS
jgi:aspartate aminotransferase